MSRFVYGYGSDNPVELSGVKTHSIDRQPQYTEDGADYLGTGVLLSFQCVMSRGLLPALPGEPPAQTMVRVQHYLETPRRTLLFEVNGDILILSPAVGAATDVRNGPFCRGVAIVQIGGSETFIINATYETWVLECPDSQGPQYLSYRYESSTSINEDFYSTTTHRGKVITRADMLVNPDTLRTVCTPALVPGFRRKKAEYILASDGLSLSFTIEDEEVFLTPPAPATWADGYHRESSPNGAFRLAETMVRLRGSKTTDKGALLQTAILVALTKLRGQNGQLLTRANKTGTVRLTHSTVQESLYRNAVEVVLRGQIIADPPNVQDLAMDLKRFVVAPDGSDPTKGEDKAPNPGTRGTAGLISVAAALGDPCLVVASDPPKVAGQSELTSLYAGIPPATVYLSSVPTTGQSMLRSTGVQGGVYEGYDVRERHVVESNRFQLPVAGQNAKPVTVQVAPATVKRYVQFNAERAADKPKLPHPDLNDGGNTSLLRAELSPEQVDLGGDGETPSWRIGGRYEYAVTDPAKNYPACPLPPWLDAQLQQDSVLTADDFQHNIIDNQPSPGLNPVLQAGGVNQ